MSLESIDSTKINVQEAKIPIRHAIYQTIKKADSIGMLRKIEEGTVVKTITDEKHIDPNITSKTIDLLHETLGNKWHPSNIDRSKLSQDQHIVVSFDIGIIHLAYCIMTIELKKISSDKIALKSYKIYDWGIINLVEDQDHKCEHFVVKLGHECGKRAAFVSGSLGEDMNLCGIHAKKYTNTKQIPPRMRADDIPIQTLCSKMVQKLDEYPIFLEVDEVLIEQQPAFGSKKILGKGQGVSVHPRMKNLSYMIYSYFIMRGIVVPKNITSKIKSVKFINSTNKLKLYDGPEIKITQKDTYKQTKTFAKEHLKYILRNQPDLINFFETYKKKDDLADCFLQGAWYLKKGIKGL